MMGQRKKWRRLSGIVLGLCMVCSQTAYAEVTIVPMPWEAGTAQPGAGSAAPNMQGTGTAPVGPSAQAAGSGNSQLPAVSGGSAQTQVAEPEVGAEGAVLMDAATGKVLYGKNQDTQFYPASITKVMTALVVLEHCNLDDVVEFSAAATTNLESGAVSLNLTEGDRLTVEQALYGLLLKSANEIGNGLAEHVAGSVGSFAELMNAKAAGLGCKNTHFANPHGLNDSTHKTTPYDMALILRAALENDTFRKIDGTASYEFPATKLAGKRTITMGHKMLNPSGDRYYQGVVGGKTGYTSLAGSTLVTGAERGGVRLIAVVMKAAGTHYDDTKTLLDYGFDNYAALAGGSGASGPSSPSQPGSGASGPSQPGSGPSSPSQSASGASSPSQPGSGASGPSQPGSGASGPSMSGSGMPGSSGGSLPFVSPASQASGQASGPSSSLQAGAATQVGAATQAAADAEPGWKEDGGRWYYIKQDKSRAAGEWQTVSGLDYWFDTDGFMATGWRRFVNGSWYYFRPSSGYAVKSGWVQDGGYWYYLGADGVLLTNTTTPDGYRVDADGIWIQE